MASSGSACLFHRLAVLHLNLAKLSTGKELGETASIEECSQQILYYYHEPSRPSSGPYEAVQFVGLCSALFSLPDNLHGFSSDECCDPTQVVHLDGSTLVYVPLEETSSSDQNSEPMLLCVAQINRAGANPLAIRCCIQRWHRLFCLLRGGGIHVRLSKYTGNNGSKLKDEKLKFPRNHHKCPYPGMDQLYKAMSTIRCLKETLTRSSNEESDLRLEQERTELREKMENFQQSLPIAALNVDLKFHYDDLIADFAQRSSTCAPNDGGVGRSIVECLPMHFAISETNQWDPGIPPPHVSFHLGLAIKDVLLRTSSLLAVSTFFQQQFLFHHGRRGLVVDRAMELEDNPSLSLLMGYFAFYRFKMNQQHQEKQQQAALQPPRGASQSFTDHLQASKNGDKENCAAQVHGSFLEVPPLAMLSASDQQTMVRGPNDKLVWAPPVYFKAIIKDAPDCEVAHAIFYEWEDYSFLFFFNPRAVLSVQLDDNSVASLQDDNCGEKVGKTLKRLSDELSSCLSLHVGTGPIEREQRRNGLLKVAGRDVIYVDRASPEVKIITRAASRSEIKPSPPRRFLDAFRPFRSAAPRNDARVDQHPCASDGMDCRHWLASRLPSDALLAIDDAMDTVNSWRQEQMRNRKSPQVQLPFAGKAEGRYEIITTTSQSWVYAYADEQREIYVLLDSNVFVTLADAHNSIKQIHDVLLCA